MNADEYNHLTKIFAIKLDHESYRILKELGFNDIEELVTYLAKHEKNKNKCDHFTTYERVRSGDKIAVVCPLCKDIMKIEEVPT